MTEAERLAERTPERIWLIDMGDCIAWCDDPDPSGTGEDDAVEYVRAALIRSQAEDLERLRGALTKATDPTWFYHPDNMESCQFGIWDVIDYYDLPPGKHVCEVECARTLPSIWCAVHVLTAEEKDAMETGESWLLTEHATEQAARAALEER